MAPPMTFEFTTADEDEIWTCTDAFSKDEPVYLTRFSAKVIVDAVDASMRGAVITVRHAKD